MRSMVGSWTTTLTLPISIRRGSAVSRACAETDDLEGPVVTSLDMDWKGVHAGDVDAARGCVMPGVCQGVERSIDSICAEIRVPRDATAARCAAVRAISRDRDA